MLAILIICTFLVNFQNGKAANLQQFFLQNKNDCAILPQSYSAKNPDYTIILSPEDKKQLYNLEQWMATLNSKARFFKGSQRLENIKIDYVENQIFLKESLPKNLYTGTIIAKIFSFIYRKIIFNQKCFYDLLKVFRALEYNSYDFGCFFELLAFGSKKRGVEDNIANYYSQIFEKLQNDNVLENFFSLVECLDDMLKYHTKKSFLKKNYFIDNLKNYPKPRSVLDIFNSNAQVLQNHFILENISELVVTFERILTRL